MREWAYAVSPYGLQLPSGGWEYTPREFHALADVHFQRVIRLRAEDRSDFYNLNFRGRGEVSWITDDFLGIGDREQRVRDEAVSRRTAERANVELLKIRAGQPPTDDVPAWARGDYHG